MRCEMPLSRVHAALDGELDVADALDVERHLRSCPVCGVEYGRVLALRSAIREGSLAATAPPELEERVRRALAAAPAGARRFAPGRALALAAALLLGVVLGGLVFSGRGLRLRSADEELVGSHVKALGVGPLTEVVSSDQHTVKPWFAGKLDLSPKVRDLSAEGFPLVGGRVDRVNGRRAAALVYRRGNHVIDLYVSVADASDRRAPATSGFRGFNLVRWTEGDLAYAAVSDLNAGELSVFADLVRR